MSPRTVRPLVVDTGIREDLVAEFMRAEGAKARLYALVRFWSGLSVILAVALVAVLVLR